MILCTSNVIECVFFISSLRHQEKTKKTTGFFENKKPNLVFFNKKNQREKRSFFFKWTYGFPSISHSHTAQRCFKCSFLPRNINTASHIRVRTARTKVERDLIFVTRKRARTWEETQPMNHLKGGISRAQFQMNWNIWQSLQPKQQCGFNILVYNMPRINIQAKQGKLNKQLNKNTSAFSMAKPGNIPAASNLAFWKFFRL